MIIYIVFYFFVGLVLLSALTMLITRNLLYTAFSLLATLLGLSALYVFCGADFLAIVQLLVYVGGILVILLFGIMLSNSAKPNLDAQTTPQAPQSLNKNVFWGISISGGLFCLLVWTIFQAKFSERPWIQQAIQKTEASESSIPVLGVGLMTDYLIPFEIAGLLLLIALVGASLIAFHRKSS